jgi:hypothetical protein
VVSRPARSAPETAAGVEQTVHGGGRGQRVGEPGRLLRTMRKASSTRSIAG